jgi:signal transduction histidine kinase
MRILAASLLLLTSPPVHADAGGRPWLERLCETLSPALRHTDERLDGISAELPRLPNPPGIPSGTSSGFSTNPVLPDQEQQWIEVILREPAEIDSVALIPAVSMGAGRPNEGFGFPKRFTLEADAGEGTDSWTMMDQTTADFPNPGIYPVVARFAPRRVQRVRLNVTKSWQDDAPSVLALAEMMLLSGHRNLAAGARVEASSHRDNAIAWQRSNLVDMSTPLGLPTVPDTAATRGYHSRVEMSNDQPKRITLDLGEASAIDELRLLPVVREGLPAWVSYGYPPRLKIETALQPDFADAAPLFRTQGKDMPAPGRNVVVFHARGAQARHLRITSERLWHRAQDFLFALAEVQVYADGKNIALGASVSASDPGDEPGWSPATLTDGFSYEQRLVELPEWLRLIEKRGQLLAEQTELLQQRGPQLSAAQDALVRIAGGLGAALVMLAVVAVWRQKRRSRREQELLRERLARDLHDDIGSNLGSIALLCNIVTKHPGDGSSHHDDFAEIQRIASESADSMRDMITLLNPGFKSRSGDWLPVLQHLAERQLRGLDLRVRVTGNDIRLGPDLETRRELYLFCKEAITNIARHAHARTVHFDVLLSDEGLEIALRDDGCGFDTTKTPRGFGLANLRQRAQQMGGGMTITSQPGQGTAIQLKLPRHRRWQTL